jgi:hypothetical protein
MEARNGGRWAEEEKPQGGSDRFFDDAELEKGRRFKPTPDVVAMSAATTGPFF